MRNTGGNMIDFVDSNGSFDVGVSALKEEKAFVACYTPNTGMSLASEVTFVSEDVDEVRRIITQQVF